MAESGGFLEPFSSAGVMISKIESAGAQQLCGGVAVPDHESAGSAQLPAHDEDMGHHEYMGPPIVPKPDLEMHPEEIQAQAVPLLLQLPVPPIEVHEAAEWLVAIP